MGYSDALSILLMRWNTFRSNILPILQKVRKKKAIRLLTIMFMVITSDTLVFWSAKQVEMKLF
jgi:hypothetical protein